MLKTISDKLFSLWPNTTNTTDKVSTGCKRKRYNDECDTYIDQDLHDSRVERKRKTELPNSFVGTIKTSISNMTFWLNSKPKRFSEEFNIIPNKKQSVPTSFNGGSPKVPQPMGNSNSTNHGFDIQHHTSHRGMVSNGTVVDEDVKNGFQLNESRNSTRSSAFHHRPSTALMCIRLKEKEEFKKLLQLQLHSQRSPWQQPVSVTVPKPSSNAIDSDIISVSSERSTSQLMDAKPSQPIFNIPRHKVTPHTSNSDYASQSFAKSIQTKSLLNTLYERHQRYNMGTVVRKPAVHCDEKFLTNRFKDHSHEAQRYREKTIDPPSQQSDDVLIIDDDDDSQPAATKSDLATNSAKEAKIQKVTDFRSQLSFLQSRFMNDREMEDEQRARSEEQKRRKLLIEEEEMKARAYERKRRAQEICLDRSLKYQMRIFDDEPQVCEEIFREEEEEEEDKLPELTSEMQVLIDRALRPGNPNEVLSEDFRLQITRRDIVTLSGLNWLNDEVINFYMNLLMRSGENGERAKLYAFNTFFYPKIKSGGHSAVRRWTKNVNIFAVHYVVIPIHLGVHWCLCVADMEKKVLTYYDSMGAENNKCLYAVLQYLHDESIAKNNTTFNRNDWQLINAEENPQQMNGGDCGMFMCMYAEYITRGKEITFTQEHMPYFRRRMVYEIISKKLLH